MNKQKKRRIFRYILENHKKCAEIDKEIEKLKQEKGKYLKAIEHGASDFCNNNDIYNDDTFMYNGYIFKFDHKYANVYTCEVEKPKRVI